jgi:hypothetical protein
MLLKVSGPVYFPYLQGYPWYRKSNTKLVRGIMGRSGVIVTPLITGVCGQVHQIADRVTPIAECFIFSHPS